MSKEEKPESWHAATEEKEVPQYGKIWLETVVGRGN